MNPKDRIDGHYWPCLGCKEKTSSPSGYCEPCRTRKCKVCGKTWTPRRLGIVKCSDCLKIRARDL